MQYMHHYLSSTGSLLLLPRVVTFYRMFKLGIS